MNYDLVIIGAGWAGFNAALKGKELGLKVALCEKDHIGGTCLNYGCIPTKTLIQSAKVFALTKKATNFGIDLNNPKINFLKIHERKDKVIQQLHASMHLMLKGVDFINAPAQLLSNEEVKVQDNLIKTKFILIATGAKPIELGNLKFDAKKIISSDEILNLKEIPQSLLIIGGGVIGCEFASLFSTLGTQVSIVEKMPQLLPGEDKEIAKKLEVSFKKRGVKININIDATNVDLSNYDLILLCVGRRPNIESLGLEKLGLNLEKERPIIDAYLKTNIPNIYAAGDCVAKTMLAHFAAYQGRIAVENMFNPSSPKIIDNIFIPNCIFTEPEIASVGLSEDEARHREIEINIDKFDFLGSGMARILDETEGMVKIISDKKTNLILGASIIGPRATELIAILTIALQSHLKISQIQKTLFAHPTLSECIGEALKKKKYAV